MSETSWRRQTKTTVLLGVAALLTACLAAGCSSGTESGGGPAASFQIDLPPGVAEAASKPEPDTVGIFFCLDTSGSMSQAVGGRAKIEISKDAMRQVFAQIAEHLKKHPQQKVKVGLCSFDNSPKLQVSVAPFDQAKLEQAIRPLRPNGGTAIGDATAMALKELLGARVEKRAIVVMTDGESNHGTPPDRVVAAIKQNKNAHNVPTADTEVFLVAFDINAGVFQGVKQAGATIKESRDQKSLQSILTTVVEEILLESPN